MKLLPLLAAASMLAWSGAVRADEASIMTRAGQTLIDHGIYFQAGYVGQAASNPIGGIRQRTDFAGQVSAGADFDLDRIFALPGSQFHITFTDRMGRSLAQDAVGNSFDEQEVYGGGRTWRLGMLAWDQALADDRVEILVGRIFSGPDFGRLPMSCSFQSNDSCPGPKGLYQNGSLNAYPIATWGGRIRVNVTAHVAFQTGAYQVDPDAGAAERHSFDFGFRRSTGAYVPVELSYQTTAADDPFPRLYKFGGYVDTSTFNDPYFDVNGHSSAVTGAPARVDSGRSGLYIALDQMVVRQTPGSRRGLHVFATADIALSSAQIQQHYLQVGLLQQGTFMNRDDDTIGFFVADNYFSSSVTNHIFDARRAAGGSERPNSHEVAAELNYGAQVTPWLLLRPNLQLIINPDQLNEPARLHNIPTALVFGFTFVVGLPQLFGMPVGNLHH